MHRKVIQTFLSSAFRPGLNVYTTPRLQFHLMKHALFCKSPSLTEATEERTDFSDLSSEEFGTLRPPKWNTRQKMEELPEEEDERIEFDITNEEGRKSRKPNEYYEKLIEKLLAEKKMVEALDVLETRIMKTDKLRPWYRVYNLLINGCAKVGYFDKAFQLYQHMKLRQVKPTAATYTGLFNAVANSPFPTLAEKKLTTLRKSLADNGIELTTINYHALIKAYARLKDTHSAFLVADEMVSKGHRFTNGTCTFLLQACISDTEAGLRHALLLWHKMRSRKIKPDHYTYNLLFRCIRDCGFGTDNDLQDVLKQITEGNCERSVLGQNSWSKRISWKKRSKKTEQLSASDAESETSSEETRTPDVLDIKCESIDSELSHDTLKNESEDELETVGPTVKECELMEPVLRENKPNLLASQPHLGSIIAVRDVKTASDRLLLLGGFNAIIQQMKDDEVKPNAKTYTLLLDIIPGTDAAEEFLLKEIKSANVPLDIDFYNMLIKKRAMRYDYEKAREVLNLVQADYLQPDIVTFGVLAVSCNKKHEAEELVHELEDFGYRLNNPIIGAMLAKACSQVAFDYILFVMKTTQRYGMRVSEKYLKTLEEFDAKVKDILRRKKRGDQTLPQFFHHPRFIENYRMWKKYYENFKEEIDVEIPQHPYQQFRKMTKELEVKENVGDEAEVSYKSEKVGYKSENARHKSEKDGYKSGNFSHKSEKDGYKSGNVSHKSEKDDYKSENFSHKSEKDGYKSGNVSYKSEKVGNKSERFSSKSVFTWRKKRNVYQNDRDPVQMNSES